VKRRDFLAELAVSAGLGVAGLPLESVRHGLNLSVAEERSAADADEWNEIALEYGESYLTAAPSDLARTLTVDMIGLQAALQRNPDARSHRELMRAAALLSVFIAQTMMNMGQVHEARRWWRTAKNFADRSGDPYSVLWVRAREINRATEYRPPEAALLLVEEAEKHAEHAPVDAALEFLSSKALTLTRAGRPHDAESVLDQLRKRSSGLAAQSGSLLAWDRAGRLHGIESFVYSRLGDLEKTQSANEAALELYGSSNLRWPADDGMKLGFCLVRKGDITEGLRNTKTILAQLPQQYRTKQMIGDAHELLRGVPESARQLNAVHEYSEWLKSL
jgi:tetratricopeptide (TPR) repeat protein